MSNKILPQKILRFPSGRSVKNCRADAKRLAKQHKHNGMTHAKALDIIANENGCSNGWDKAIRQLTLSAQGISRESKKEQISEQNLFDSLIPKSLQSLLDNISKITEPAKFITRNFDTNNQALNDYEKLLAQVKSPIPAATESMIRQAAEELSKMTMPLAQAIPDYERLVEQWKIPTATQEFIRQAEELSKMTMPLAQAIPDYERLVEQWKIPTATQEFMRQAEELSKMTKPLAQVIPDYERLAEQLRIPTATQEIIKKAEELSKTTINHVDVTNQDLFK